MVGDDAIHTIKVASITDQDDGSAIVEFDLTEEFRNWFKRREGLKRWSQKRFQKFVIDGLRLYLDQEEQKQGLMAELADATDLKSVEG